MAEGHPRDECLQCGQSRAQVKANGPYCATVTGYEYVETLDEWDRHHWRDWSDAELKRHGLLPEQYDEHRRTNIYDLEFPARAAHCKEHGHSYPKAWHPPMHRDLLSMYSGMEHVCMCCYETRMGNESDDHH